MMKTKNLLMLVLLIGLAVVFKPAQASAKAAEDILAARVGAQPYWVQASSSDSKAIWLWYTGSATEAVVTIDHNSIDAFAPYNVADTSFGTSGSYDTTAAAYDTMGELCDAINGLADYGCVLLGAKRDDNSLLLRDQTQASGTNDLKAAGGFQVLFGTGSATASPVNKESSFILRLGATPRLGKKLVLKKCEWYVNGADNVRIYGCDVGSSPDWLPFGEDPIAFTPGACSDVTKVYEEVIADDTAESADFTSTSGDDGWTFGVNQHVVISGGNNASVQVAANYLRCLFEER